MATVKMCRCGCRGPAEFLVSGIDLAADGHSPGKPFTDEPCCARAADYLSESSHEMGGAIAAAFRQRRMNAER